MLCICHAYGKCPGSLEILCCLMSGTDAERNLVSFTDSSTCCVHCIRRAVLIVCCENKYRLWIGVWFCSKIFSCHINSLLFVLCFELFGRMNSFLCFIPHIFAGIKRGQDIYRFFVGLCPTAFASWDICRFCEQLCPITSGVWDI